MSKKAKFSILMLVGFISYSLMYNQIVPYLIEIGYTTAQRSVILASFALVAMVGQILVGFLSDKYSTIKRFFVYVSWLFIATGLASFWLNKPNFWFHFFIISFMAAFTRIQCNILETWVLQVDGLYHDFGSIRAFGSIGWAVASYIGGALATRFGFISLGIVNTGLNVILIFYSFKLADIGRKEHQKATITDFKNLLKNRKFILLLFVFLFVFFVYNVDSILVTELIYSFGGNAADAGLRGFIHAIVEVPMMFLVGRLLIKYKSKRVLMFGVVMMMLKFVLFGLSKTIFAVDVFTLLQMVSFPLILIAQRDMINHVVAENVRSTGQMITSAVTSGVSAIMSPLVAGFLSINYGVSWALIIIGLSLIIPLILVLGYSQEKTL